MRPQRDDRAVSMMRRVASAADAVLIRGFHVPRFRREVVGAAQDACPDQGGRHQERANGEASSEEV